jgi:hypothetical protein
MRSLAEGNLTSPLLDQAAADYLKERTRNDKLVLKTNCEYGFLRNAFGLMPYGIGRSILSRTQFRATSCVLDEL